MDSTGASFAASVIYSSATQINFTIPAGLDAGPATVTIQSANAGAAAQSAGILIAPTALSLFSVNQGGLAAAYITRVAPGGAQTNEPIFNLQNGTYTPIPIDVTNGQVYLILYGTGIRNATRVTLFWNQAEIDTLYADKQPTFPGLDQVNVLLPAAMAGSGCTTVSLMEGYLSSNPVYVCIK